MRDIRRKNQTIPPSECETILHEGTSGVLALLGDEDYPYTVPMSYVYDKDCEKIFFHCGPTGHKIDAINKHDKASFCVVAKDEVIPEKYTTAYTSVIVFGRIKIITDDVDKRRSIELLAAKYSPDHEAGRLAEIDRQYKAITMLELAINDIKGKESKWLLQARKATKD